ncbi:MAG: hypothetical protein ACE5IB_07710 [Candidatus Geothermarchaeales archaeon]
MVYTILKQLPLATLIVWLTIGAFQLYRKRTRTLTEISFVLGSISWAGYAASDWLIFNTPDHATAFLLARMSLTFVTLAAFFLLLFPKLFLTRAQKTDVLLLIPLGLALALVWDGMLLDMEGGVPWNWTGVFDPNLFLIWLIYVVVYASVGIWYVYRTYLVVRENSKFLGWRMFGIFVSLLVTLALGLGTNAVFETLGIGLMPLFSSLLVFPGLITMYVLVPLTKQRISTVMRRWKRSMYNILGAYIIYENGTLIASRTSFQDKKVDDDIFGATLDAIQNFMRTSFPLLLGKWLRRIEHGDVKILIERGRHSYIALVIAGEDTDTLWIRMKEAVERFEGSNELKLVDWNGIPDDLNMVEETLSNFYSDRAVFA